LTLRVDFSLSFTLVISQFNQEREIPKRNVRLILLVYFTKRYFFYYCIVILPLFGFQRGYDMTERSNFILTEIDGYYNSNDRWKFILFFD